MESLRSLCKNGGAKLIRLDAFGYVTKKAGTNCFMEVRHGLHNWMILGNSSSNSSSNHKF